MASDNRIKVAVESKTIIVDKTPKTVSYKKALCQDWVSVLHVNHPKAKLADEVMFSIRKLLASKINSALEGPKIQLTSVATN